MKLQEIPIEGELLKAWEARNKALAGVYREHPLGIAESDNSAGNRLRRAEFTVLASFVDREFLEKIVQIHGRDAIVEMDSTRLQIFRVQKDQAA